MNTAARIISIVFHPLLMATYLFALLSFVLPVALDPIQASGHIRFLILIFMITFLLPSLNFFIFKLFGVVRSTNSTPDDKSSFGKLWQSFTMPARSERIIPFTFITILYIAITYLFYSRFRVSLSDNILKLMLIIDLLLLVATMITFFYKVSIHSLAIWGVLGIVIRLNKFSEDSRLLIPIIAIIIIAGFVMSSRLQLKAHSPREVLIGTCVGLVTSLVGMAVLF